MAEHLDATIVSRESYLTRDDILLLKILIIAYYVLGGLGIVFSLLIVGPVQLGWEVVSGTAVMEGVSPSEGWLYLIAGLAVLILCEAVSIGMILSARHIRRRTGYLFSFVLACVLCLFVPVGAMLGLFTMLVLIREPVKAAYGRR